MIFGFSSHFRLIPAGLVLVRDRRTEAHVFVCLRIANLTLFSGHAFWCGSCVMPLYRLLCHRCVAVFCVYSYFIIPYDRTLLTRLGSLFSLFSLMQLLNFVALHSLLSPFRLSQSRALSGWLRISAHGWNSTPRNNLEDFISLLSTLFQPFSPLVDWETWL